MTSNSQSEISDSDIDHSSQLSQAPIEEEGNLPSWVQFHLKKFLGRVEYSSGVIMGHYLVVLVHDVIIEYEEKEHEEEPEREQTATLLAFNLQDHTVQEARIDNALFVPQGGHYSFLKYGENQIIKFGGLFERHDAARMICITVESFEPFKVKCKKIVGKNEKKTHAQTAQIYKDKLYVLQSRKELWSFDLKNHTWELCKTTGEVPEFAYFGVGSFIYQDNLFLYGAVGKNIMIADLFMLDFNSMIWKKIGQHEKYLGLCDDENEKIFGGTVYQGHLITLENFINFKENTLCFLNLQTKDTWTTFEIKGIDENAKIYDDNSDDGATYDDVFPEVSGLMTYKTPL